MKSVDMSPEAVTNRMTALDELWELAIALKSSQIVTGDAALISEDVDANPRPETLEA